MSDNHFLQWASKPTNPWASTAKKEFSKNEIIARIQRAIYDKLPVDDTLPVGGRGVPMPSGLDGKPFIMEIYDTYVIVQKHDGSYCRVGYAPSSDGGVVLGEMEPVHVVWVESQNTSETTKGGPGSGNFGHAGRPGKKGGSAPNKGGGAGGVASGKIPSGKGSDGKVSYQSLQKRYLKKIPKKIASALGDKINDEYAQKMLSKALEYKLTDDDMKELYKVGGQKSKEYPGLYYLCTTYIHPLTSAAHVAGQADKLGRELGQPVDWVSPDKDGDIARGQTSRPKKTTSDGPTESELLGNASDFGHVFAYDAPDEDREARRLAGRVKKTTGYKPSKSKSDIEEWANTPDYQLRKIGRSWSKRYSLRQLRSFQSFYQEQIQRVYEKARSGDKRAELESKSYENRLNAIETAIYWKI